MTNRENQIVTIDAVSIYKGKVTRTVPHVNVTRIVERGGKTFGTCKIDGVAYAVVLKEDNRWTVNG